MAIFVGWDDHKPWDLGVFPKVYQLSATSGAAGGPSPLGHGDMELTS